MRIVLEIQNLKCGGCEKTVLREVNALEGVNSASVRADEGTVSFEYESEDHLSAARELLTSIGYPVAGEANPLGRKMKSYLSCAKGRFG